MWRIHLGFQLKDIFYHFKEEPVAFGNIAQVCLLTKISHWCFLFNEFLGIVKFWITPPLFFISHVSISKQGGYTLVLGRFIRLCWGHPLEMDPPHLLLSRYLFHLKHMNYWCKCVSKCQGICFISNIWIIGVNVCPNVKGSSNMCTRCW